MEINFNSEIRLLFRCFQCKTERVIVVGSNMKINQDVLCFFCGNDIGRIDKEHTPATQGLIRDGLAEEVITTLINPPSD